MMSPVVYTRFLPCLVIKGPAKGEVRKMTAGKQAKTMPTASLDMRLASASCGKNEGRMEKSEWQNRLLTLISTIISSCRGFFSWGCETQGRRSGAGGATRDGLAGPSMAAARHYQRTLFC